MKKVPHPKAATVISRIGLCPKIGLKRGADRENKEQVEQMPRGKMQERSVDFLLNLDPHLHRRTARTMHLCGMHIVKLLEI